MVDEQMVEVEDVSVFEELFRDPPPLQMGQVPVVNSEPQPQPPPMPMPLRTPTVAPQSLFMPESMISSQRLREQEEEVRTCSIC